MGYWDKELVGPLEVLDAEGYETIIVTPRGKRPHALPLIIKGGCFEPPPDEVVIDEYCTKKTREIDAATRLDRPVNLSEWFPERPYFNLQGS